MSQFRPRTRAAIAAALTVAEFIPVASAAANRGATERAPARRTRSSRSPSRPRARSAWRKDFVRSHRRHRLLVPGPRPGTGRGGRQRGCQPGRADRQL